MIRTLKAMLLASMALAVFGALAASSAHAAEERFHCASGPCKYTALPDEVANTKTAHHVFIVERTTPVVESVSFTCGQLTGAGEKATATANEVEIGANVGIAGALLYKECTVQGSEAVTVNMNGCKYNFKGTGPFVATSTAEKPQEDATVQITGCEAGKKIEIVYSGTGCKATIGEQGPLKGINFHNHKGVKELLTVETNVKGIAVTFDGTKAQCLINPEGTLEGTYTTGNTLVTGETPVGVMQNVWFE